MKWIPLSEQKPEEYIYCFFCDDTKYSYQDSIPSWATHWLEFELPSLPQKEMSKEDEMIQRLKKEYEQNLKEHNFAFKPDLFIEILEILKTKANK